MAFFFEVLITGLLVGIMYSLVALGFALIYKASDVFNFAQGDMSLLAGLALVGFLTVMPLWLALVCTIAVMTILAYATVFIIFRPLVWPAPRSSSSWPPLGCRFWSKASGSRSGERKRKG